jgi:HD-GYP domain-containing protein (c-di-GMP phosphodiesterase class II)
VPDHPRKGMKRYAIVALAATLGVTTLPLVVVSGVESALGFRSLLLALPLGAALSCSAALIGSRLWMRFGAASELVFADLMIWGFVKRVRSEKFVDDMRQLLRGSSRFCRGSDVDPERQIRLLQRLANALEATDAYTHGHTRRVAHHACRIAQAMKLPPEEIEMIRTAAAVHDVGKIYVPYELLTKSDRLTDDEFELLRAHASRGAALVAEVGNPVLTALVRHHHERLDGKGYPDGLSGEQIPLGARIIAVADTFDAITSNRSYRAAARHERALEILRNVSGSQLDPAVVEAFVTYYSGRDSIAWWASATTVPQRLVVRVLSLVHSAGGSGLAGTAAAGAAMLVTSAAVGLGAVPHSLALDAAPSDGSRLVASSTSEPRSERAIPSTIPSGTGDRLSLVASKSPRASSEVRHANDRTSGPVGDAAASGADASGGTGDEEPSGATGADEPSEGSGSDNRSPPTADGAPSSPVNELLDEATDVADGATDAVDGVEAGVEQTVDETVESVTEIVPQLP